jgi:hypothetical protein
MSFEYDRDIINHDDLKKTILSKPHYTDNYLLTPNDILNQIDKTKNYDEHVSMNNLEKKIGSLLEVNNISEIDESSSSEPEFNEESGEESGEEYGEESYEDEEWENIANTRLLEIKRKENIIQQKDEKATRLIGIIRLKNNEIIDAKKKLLEQQRLIWKLYKRISDISKNNNDIIEVSEVI